MSVISGQSVLLDIEELTVDEVVVGTGALDDAFAYADLYFELGQWLAGLETFCSIGYAVYLQGRERPTTDRKYLAEFSITRAVLLRCAELIHALRADKATDPEFARSSLNEVEKFIPDALVLNNALARSPQSGGSEWQAWCNAVAERLSRLKIVKEFGNEFPQAGKYALPDAVQTAMLSESISRQDRRDLQYFLPRLGGTLKSLSIIGKMLERDLPIRPSLVIFSYIYEVLDDLVNDMNARLAVHPDETSELFGIIDATSYTLSMDSKKIFSQELRPILDMSSATKAFAQVEAAYSVLNDNIRQLLAGFAQLAEPDATPNEMFPDFHEKLEHSIELRARLWLLLKSVRKAEDELTDEALNELRMALGQFLSGQIAFLFYKDRETFERFCTEIELTASVEDAGPIVHRFSAYVETLFSLVQMRAVLANHPMPAAE